MSSLRAAGLTDREISRASGVPIDTIRAWRRRGAPRLRVRAVCPHCGGEPHDWETLPHESYAYLLGLYLGDGCLAKNAASLSLRISLDTAYPEIIAEACQAVEAVIGRPPTIERPRNMNMVNVQLTAKQWRCLFPQHGPGRKHLRPIVLVPWQQDIVVAHPGRLLRGLIQTDGWRGVNKVHAKGRDYEYPRYQFSNRSDDIRRIFTDACDLLGIEWRQWTRYHVSVAKRESVARLDEHVGPKR